MALAAPTVRTICVSVLVTLLCVYLMLIFIWASGSTRQSRNIEKEETPWRSDSQAIKPIHVPEVRFDKDVIQTGKIFPDDAAPPSTVDGEFIVENSGLCSRYLTLTYLVVVHTAPNNFDRRQALRQTWANQTLLPGVNSLTIFLLGKPSTDVLQNSILAENRSHRDIVQGDFIDDYKNLTLKAVIGLKWIVKNCKNAAFVVKVDDDVFVNMFRVKDVIFPLLQQTPQSVVCSVEPHAFIFREGEAHESNRKWMVSQSFFPRLPKYPMPFCYGFATFYTTLLAAELFETAKSTPFYRLDDVYVYGILVSKVWGASWHNQQHFYKDEDATVKAFAKGSPVLVGTTTSRITMENFFKKVKPK